MAKAEAKRSIRERVERLEQENQALYRMILEDRQVMNKLAEEVLRLEMLMPGNDNKKLGIDFRRLNERQ